MRQEVHGCFAQMDRSLALPKIRARVLLQQFQTAWREAELLRLDQALAAPELPVRGASQPLLYYRHGASPAPEAVVSGPAAHPGLTSSHSALQPCRLLALFGTAKLTLTFRCLAQTPFPGPALQLLTAHTWTFLWTGPRADGCPLAQEASFPPAPSASRSDRLRVQKPGPFCKWHEEDAHLHSGGSGKESPSHRTS